jgi:hypothetical protein
MGCGWGEVSSRNEAWGGVGGQGGRDGAGDGELRVAAGAGGVQRRHVRVQGGGAAGAGGGDGRTQRVLRGRVLCGQ